MKSVGDNFWSQVPSESARKDALLDFQFVNREGLVGYAVVAGWLCHSYHEMIEFRIFSAISTKVSRVATLDFKTANFKLLRNLFSSEY